MRVANLRTRPVGFCLRNVLTWEDTLPSMRASPDGFALQRIGEAHMRNGSLRRAEFFLMSALAVALRSAVGPAATELHVLGAFPRIQHALGAFQLLLGKPNRASA